MAERKTHWTFEDVAAVKTDAAHIAWQDKVIDTLAGQAPQHQAMILAELVARWLSGHEPSMRQAMLKEWTKLTVNLIPVVERERFGDQGWPGN